MPLRTHARLSSIALTHRRVVALVGLACLQGVAIGVTLSTADPRQIGGAIESGDPAARSALVVGTPGLDVGGATIDHDPRSRTESEVRAASSSLVGMWVAVQPQRYGQELRFLYFHTDGAGLYRYGQEGMAWTKSFSFALEQHATPADPRVSPGEGRSTDRDGLRLALRYRKSGDEVEIEFTTDVDREGRPCIVLNSAPFRGHDAAGASTQRYCKVRGAISREGAGDTTARLSPAEVQRAAAALEPVGSPRPPLKADSDPVNVDRDREAISLSGPSSPLADHVWMDLQRFATGGYAFAMYQFAPAKDGVPLHGWYHQGDFDDWTTEALHASSLVRAQSEGSVAGSVTICFRVAGRCEQSGFRIASSTDTRTATPLSLTLTSDPRDGWYPHTYLDQGRSF